MPKGTRLHCHPRMEEKHGVPDGHVIVDRDALELAHGVIVASVETEVRQDTSPLTGEKTYDTLVSASLPKELGLKHGQKVKVVVVRETGPMGIG